ncbi:MAG: carboxypeptidase regulatory-like domain-containing protein [Planctomycetaceae bacterium]|nr:carboxypeptidase regulatory-like domain-containing protein [Planctomycetaceae bacterium]
MRLMFMKNRCAAPLLLGLILLGGCTSAPPTGGLQGTVTFEGTPVKDATIQLQSATTGTAFAAPLDANGSYRFEKSLPTGEYNVIITPVAGAGDDGIVGATPQARPPEKRDDIPERYRTMGQSGLKVDVKPGNENVYDVKLTK